MNDQLENMIIFYNADTALLDATTAIKYEIIEYLDLNRPIGSVRYELQHLHRKIELQLDL